MDTAYANIGLDANTVWRDSPGDGFQKFSDKLWVKLNYLKEKKHHQVGEKGKVVTVHDVIRQSKLAQYGNYSYDNDRELMYNRGKPLRYPEEVMKFPEGEGLREPWMLTEVEQEFRRLTRNCSQPYDLYNGFKPVNCVEVEDSIQKKYPVLAKKCQPNSIDPEDTLETIYLPNPFYRIDDLNQLELQMRITSTKHIWERPARNLITKKYNQPLRCGSYPEEERRGERNEGKWRQPFPRGPGDANGKTGKSARSWCRGAETKSDIFAVVKKKSPSDGRDFANLTLLTRPVNRHESCGPDRSAFRVPETVLKWLHTGYPTRSQEFSAIQNLTEELRTLRTGLQGSTISSFIKDRQGKPPPEVFDGKKCEFSQNLYPNLDNVVYCSENLSTSPSSSSSSEQNRCRDGSGWKVETSNSSCSGGPSTCRQTGAPKRSNRIGRPGPAEEKATREGPDGKRFLEGMAGMRPWPWSAENGFDDLERQAIEQWPSDDSIDAFRSKRLQ